MLPEAKVRPRPRKWQPDCIQAKHTKSTALEAAPATPQQGVLECAALGKCEAESRLHGHGGSAWRRPTHYGLVLVVHLLSGKQGSGWLG